MHTRGNQVELMRQPAKKELNVGLGCVTHGHVQKSTLVIKITLTDWFDLL